MATPDFELDQAYVARFGEAPRSLHFELRDTRLHALQWGDDAAPPLLLVHGMRAHARWFTTVGPALAPRYRTLAVDLRGHGCSAHTSPYGIDVYADDIAQLVEALAPQRPLLVGHSMGGRVTSHAAARLGSKVRGLVLIDSYLGPPFRPQPPAPGAGRETAERTPAPFRSFEQARARFKLRPGPTIAAPELLDHLARHAIEACDDGTFRYRSDPNLRRQSHLTPMPPIDGTGVRCPITSIWGALSPMLRLGDPRELSERFPSAPFTAADIVADAYHHTFLDQPEAFNRLLLSQLDALEARAPQ